MTTASKETEPAVSVDTLPQLDTAQTGLEASLERLSMEALRFLCKSLGVSELGQKKDIVARLVKDGRARMGSEMPVFDSETSGKAKNVHFSEIRDESFSEEPDACQWSGDRPQQARMGVESLYDPYGRQVPMGLNSVHSGARDTRALGWGTDLGLFPLDDLERRNIWEKRELSKQRNQWEYNEWCKAGALMDKALASGDLSYLRLARQVALERAYVVRVADEDGWEVAS